MKIKIAMFFFIGIICANASPEDIPFSAEWILEGDIVKSDVVVNSEIESKMRDICFTNVFQSITTNGFIMVDLMERKKEGQFDIQGADFRVENNKIIFEVGYYATTNKITGGLAALARSTWLYSSMNPPWVEQYLDGPGNVCLLPINSNVNNPTKIQNVFFCRDNVALRVRNSFGGDILAFVKLLDDCILASSIEETK